jgi:RNA polymerase sigma-70 factor, ECF subfamily
MTSAALLERYRPALTGHCYRMLGSVLDAEDAVQESMLRAWKGLHRFQQQSSLKTWLYKIATNVCLDTLATSERRRVRPLETTESPAVVSDELVLKTRPREDWLEPIPDAAALPASDACSPEERAILRESIHLAFVAALQHLPPRQRAVLLSTQVLNWSAAETADALGMTVASVNSALQRARATLDAGEIRAEPCELTEEQRRLVSRYVDAFERYDIGALGELLHDDATLSMPPYDMWLRGRESISKWMLGLGSGCRGSRLVPVSACGGMPAFAQYRRGGAEPWAIVVLELRDARIGGVTTYLDVETLFPRFELPRRLP